MSPNLATAPSPGSQFGGALSPSAQPTRLLSLDLLRGVTIAFMILVNNAGDFGSAYWPLLHSAWNGCTPTDVVFPTFLFLIGITTVISLSLESGYTNRQSALDKRATASCRRAENCAWDSFGC
ncbi:MAG: heparan-alpha-glucosaminide N-acetyltransferase domain-containing protein [Acidobacteriaceae bacterium]